MINVYVMTVVEFTNTERVTWAKTMLVLRTIKSIGHTSLFMASKLLTLLLMTKL